MAETLSIRIDAETKRRLDALAERSHRSPAALAEEAIACYLEAEARQLAEIEAGIADIDAGRSVGHDQVRSWLESWGTPMETKAPK